MTSGILSEVLTLVDQVRYVLVATADGNGVPHLASSGHLAPAQAGQVVLREWFCPTTLENVRHNPNVAVVVWDKEHDIGYQLLGIVERIEDRALLNGYAPDLETGHAVPQVERELIVRVERVLTFSQARHRDQPLVYDQRGAGR